MTVRSKKRERKKRKKVTRFLKLNTHKKAGVVTKISNCGVNTTSRGEIKQLGISFVSIFLLFSYESILGKTRAPPLNDSPVLLLFFSLLFFSQNCA